MSSPGARAFGYRPALDGLRAIAVGGVMIYHAGLPWLPGGFLGVDVFFVLSGYLITSLLFLEAGESNHIRLLAFWGRRFRRLLPALLLLLVAVAFYVALFVDPSRFERMRADGLSALFYVSNWQFILNEQSYFDAFHAPSPLLHTWSLGIEEQWYLLWPLTLLGLHRLTRGSDRGLFAFSLLAALASAAWMAWLFVPGEDPSRVYYGTDTRAQNLLIGSALAFVLPRWMQREGSQRWARWGGSVGAVVLLAMMFLLSDRTGWLYRGGFLVCAIATALVIAGAGQSTGWLRAALGVAPMRFIGRISYGLYLWHWPIYLLLIPDRVGFEGPALFALRVGSTFAIASLSYYLLEAPIRAGLLGGAPIRVLAVASVAGVAGLFLFVTEPVEARFDRDRERLVTLDSALRGGEGTLRVGILGDSIAHSLAISFPASELGGGFEIVNRSTVGCGVGMGDFVYGGYKWAAAVECADWPGRWWKLAGQELDLVILAVGAWEVVDRMIDRKLYSVGSPAYAQYIETELEAGLAPILDAGIPVVVLTLPCLKQKWGAFNFTRLAPQKERSQPSRVTWVNHVLEAFASEHVGRVDVIDLHEYTCQEDGTPGRVDDVELQPDGVHFGEEGGRQVWLWLAPRLDASARRNR